MHNKKPIKSLIPKTWAIPNIFRDRLGTEVGRQRLMCEDDHFLVILHLFPTAKDKGNREGALFWINTEAEWKSFPEPGGRKALRKLVESYRGRLSDLNEELDTKSTPEGIHEVIDEAAPILRAARHMLTVLEELRDALPEDRDILAIRDLAVSIERGADLLVQDAKTSLDFLVAKSASSQANAAASATEEARKLNRLAAFFFPLLTLTSICGMSQPSKVMGFTGVWIVLLLGLAMGLIVSIALRK